MLAIDSNDSVAAEPMFQLSGQCLHAASQTAQECRRSDEEPQQLRPSLSQSVWANEDQS